jgi:hypothetical protein
MENHTHGDDGMMILSEPEPVAELTDAAVEIARIEADRDVTLAKLAKGLELDLADTDIDVLRAERDLLREQLTALTTPPPQEGTDPVVIVADDASQDQPEVIDETLPAPESVIEDESPAPRKVGLGMW